MRLGMQALAQTDVTAVIMKAVRVYGVRSRRHIYSF